jgi:cytosine/adenosine deaminase-related metal-dependent hydrolase
MTMKRTELDKRKGLQIANEMRQAGHRFDTSAPAVDRREQRERDRAAGLVPFAVKLHGDLVRQLHELARQRGLPLNDLVDQLLRTGTEKEEGPR